MCLPMIRQVFDTMNVALTNKALRMVMITWHQNLSLGKCWKLFLATLLEVYFVPCYHYLSGIKRLT